MSKQKIIDFELRTINPETGIIDVNINNRFKRGDNHLISIMFNNKHHMFNENGEYMTPIPYIDDIKESIEPIITNTEKLVKKMSNIIQNYSDLNPYPYEVYTLMCNFAIENNIEYSMDIHTLTMNMVKNK